ncbi:MAG: hypothetical protein ACREND_02855 [Gemmatimonadaceae bacterium]
MPGVLFRLLIDDAAASREEIASVETITVELEIDMAAEARLMIPICTNDGGGWTTETAPLIRSARRIRIEVKVGNGAWTPLIDGPVVRIDTRMSPDPSQSSVTMVVSDDSIWLSRDDAQQRFDDLADSEVALKLFQIAPQIASTDIEDTPAAGSSGTAVVVQRGTAMALLARLARRNGMNAYVRPGADSGASVGVFRSLPTRGDGIPDLILLGSGRNLMHWDGADDNEQPAKVVTYSLDVLSKTVTTATAGLDDLTLMGSDQTLVNGATPASRVLKPCHGTIDPQQRVAAEALRSSFAVDASGEVMSDCYTGVLLPYHVVTVRAVDGRQSGDYVVKQVTHSLGRSIYSQRFQLMRNARSAGAKSNATAAPAGIS